MHFVSDSSRFQLYRKVVNEGLQKFQANASKKQAAVLILLDTKEFKKKNLDYRKEGYFRLLLWAKYLCCH